MSDAPAKFRQPPRHEGCDCFLLDGGTFRTGGRCIRGDCDCKQFDGMYAGYEAEVAIAVARLRALHDRRTDVGCSAETPCNWAGCPFGGPVPVRPTGATSTTEAPGAVALKATIAAGELGVAPTTESPGSATAKPEHPSPWAWDPWKDDPAEDMMFFLMDAKDSPVLLVNGDFIQVASTLAREQIRAAPEMEEALRHFVTMLGDIRPAHPKMVAAMNILASIDAARKATT